MDDMPAFDRSGCEGGLRLRLVKAYDENQKDEVMQRLAEVKKGLSKDNTQLDYEFDSALHDRWIESDIGWRIILGRGLAIFRKPDDKFALRFMDQTKRWCKASTVTYARLTR